MARFALVFGLFSCCVLVPCVFAQTPEIQDQVELRLLLEKLIKDVRQHQAALGKDIHKLQEAVVELREQLEKQKKKETAQQELEILRAKLADAERRLKLAEARGQEETARAHAALEEARRQAARAEALLRELQDQIRRLERDLKSKDVDPTPKPLPPVDVPKELVKGKVIKVDKEDRALIEIDVGSDDGLKGGQTLEIYRLKPQPTYLGSVRIVQVRPARSVGRVVVTNPLKELAVKVGDYVTSKLPTK